MPLREGVPKDSHGASKRSRVYAGRLLDHGEAPYKFKEQNEASYFVRLQTEEGQKELWGVDLPRALEKAGVQKGDLIQVQLAGRKTVSVKRTTRDGQGGALGEEEVSVHRNEWEVQPQAGDADAAPRTARSKALHEPAASARDNPALTSALMLLRGAELLAEARIPDVARRAQFVDGVRAQVSQVLDGDGIPPAPHLRARVAERTRASARVMS
jgi:hypothetical protein